MKSKLNKNLQNNTSDTAAQGKNIREIINAHQLSRRKFLQGSAMAAAALSVGPFFMREVSAAATANEWRVGTIFSLTGNLAFGGNECLAGCEVARAIVNDRGGADTLSGKKKIVFVKADAPNPTAATTETVRLITREKVQLITGSFSSSISYPATAAAERYKVLYWESTAVVDDLTKRGFQYLFRCLAPVSESAWIVPTYAAEYIAPKLGKKPQEFKTVIIWEDGTFGSSAHTTLVESAKKHNLNVVLDESYSAKSPDLSPVILKLKAVDPDIILAVSATSDAVLLCKHMRELDVNPIAIIGTSSGWTLPDTGKMLGKNADGIFSSDASTNINPNALSPKALALRNDFLKRYTAMYKRQPSSNAWCAFSGSMILLDEVLPKVKSLDPEEVKEAALSLDLPHGSMPTGYGVKFIPHDKPNGGQNSRAFCIMTQWWDGATHVVYPERYANDAPRFIPLPSWEERS